MIEEDIVVRTRGGLHAMVATRIAAIAEGSGGKILLALASDPRYQVDASDLTAVLSLGVAEGESVTVTCDGARAEQALSAIGTLLRADDGPDPNRRGTDTGRS